MILGYVFIVFVVTACLWGMAHITRREEKDGVWYHARITRRWTILLWHKP